MSKSTPPEDAGDELSAQRHRVELCDHFERAWRRGDRPLIESFGLDVPESLRPTLVRELLRLEIGLRLAADERPTPEEYGERFPTMASSISLFFDELKPLRSRMAPKRAATGPGSASTPDTGYNLLFGLLALQNNFIDREALLAAFNTWLVNKSRSLGRILLERGVLTASRHMLMDALVKEHISVHGNDPQKSLAVISSIGSVREDLLRIPDHDLHASLSQVSVARNEQNDDPFGTVASASVGDLTSTGSRFRILRPHAKGGLGEVFVARDTELHREVALKEIQDRYADDPLYRARFKFEAEITGGLEHPGIVPVYGLGHDPSGRPFYAMRFIRGESLKEAIHGFHQREKLTGRHPGQMALELRELLGRFIDVCDAVAYAHSRGVLHRDLKPGNIMLGRYGETLVVDWGLARELQGPDAGHSAGGVEHPLRPPSGSQLDSTQAGATVGTPAYMSPEQAAGRLDALGARSDVYCLGATMYHLLTGRAPCEAEQIGEVYQKVMTGNIPRPRSLNHRIAPALESICLKALALRPDDRYESAEDLKSDVERWLADEPVTAKQEPIHERLARWGRHHKPFVAGLMVFLLIVPTALAAIWVIWNRLIFAETRRFLAEKETQTARQLQLTQDYLRLIEPPAELDRALDWTSTRFSNLKKAAELDVPDRDPVRLRSEIVNCLAAVDAGSRIRVLNLSSLWTRTSPRKFRQRAASLSAPTGVTWPSGNTRRLCLSPVRFASST